MLDLVLRDVAQTLDDWMLFEVKLRDINQSAKKSLLSNEAWEK